MTAPIQLKTRFRNSGGIGLGKMGDGAAAFDPKSIAGLKAWIDFSDKSTLFTDAAMTIPAVNDGDAIGAVKDKSGNNNNFTQATAGNKPSYRVAIKNGLSIARLTSAGQSELDSNSFQSYPNKRGCIFIVSCPTTNKITAGQSGAPLTTIGGSGQVFAIYTTAGQVNSGNTLNHWYDTTTGYANTPAYDPLDEFYIADFHRTGDTTLVTHRNGAPETYTIGNAQLAANVHKIGIGGFNDTDIAEILIYDDITEASRLLVQAALSKKWSVPVVGGIDVVAFGDSIARGSMATTPTNRWLNIVATTRGWKHYESGYGGATLQNTVQNTAYVIGGAVLGNGRDRYSTGVLAYSPTYVLIMYGTNDILSSDVAITTTLFESDYGELIDGLVAGGISAQNIVIASPSWMNMPVYGGTVAKQVAYTAKCAAVAAAKGTKYIDVYQYMIDHYNPLTLVDIDNVHPNNAGHAAIAAAFLTVI